MLVSIYIEEHDYLVKEPQVLNFGGQYLYSFIPKGNTLIIKRKFNERFIPNFFDVAKVEECEIKLISAIVGQNGVGKSSILDIIRGAFVENRNSFSHCTSTFLIEINNETKVLFSNGNYKTFYIEDEDCNRPKVRKIEKLNLESFQTIYYSPHFDLKYNNNFDEVDKYDISLDQFIKDDLVGVEEKGTNENGFRFELQEELVFKNSMRQVEFLSSSIFRENIVFRDVFNLPQYEMGVLYFREVNIREFDDTPRDLIPIIEMILAKLNTETKKWSSLVNQNPDLLTDEKLKRVTIDKYFLHLFIIKAFLSIVIQHMEKSNIWLEEGKIKDLDVTDHLSAFDVFKYFIEESYIEKGSFKKKIFNSDIVLSLFDKLTSVFDMEINPDNISKRSIRLNLNDIKEILELHRRVINNLYEYYPLRDGLRDEHKYIEGFISFRPTDKNLSSGENALLNFFSKLYAFIQDNLLKERKSLPNKENYILLLDEADLGFHPIWKKRYISAILQTIPHFFEILDVKPAIQIIITTHDPLTLSDFPINNVVFLQKDEDFCSIVSETSADKIQKTFGANITDLLAHSFFVENGLIGDFSKMKIVEVIEWIKKKQGLTLSAKSKSKFKEELEYYKSVVSLIDEKVVKLKLAEMITDLVPNDDYYDELIDKEIELLKSKKKNK